MKRAKSQRPRTDETMREVIENKWMRQVIVLSNAPASRHKTVEERKSHGPAK